MQEEKQAARWADPANHKKQSDKMKEICSDLEYKKQMQLRMEERWQDEAYVEAQRKIQNDPEYRENQRQKALRNWQDPEYIQNVMDGKKTTPNRLEALFDSLTNDKIVFVGDGSFWRKWPNGRRKNPDFLVYNKDGSYEKMVIELWGTFWHKDDDPMLDITMWSRLGYQCLILWEHAIHDNPEQILDLVSSFIGEEARSDNDTHGSS
jgi:very-short-patch-repair endonuclease